MTYKRNVGGTRKGKSAVEKRTHCSIVVLLAAH
jgi:hypothetical protein